MITIVKDTERTDFNRIAPHPLQSWEWGEFRTLLGTKVIRLGRYEHDILVETSQFTIHPIPHTPWSVGYLPKNTPPSSEMLTALIEYGKRYNCIFIKLEPNILSTSNQTIHNPYLVHSKHPLFTKYTFRLNLDTSEDELLKHMQNKTRYNIRVAQKHHVSVQEETDEEAVDDYIKLTFDTTKRQQFYAHNEHYHRVMWKTMHEAKIAHLLTASYQGKRLVTWIVFLFNGILYYPYGASSNEHRNVMASNLMMWEAIRWGKAHGATMFDMWGSLGPDPAPDDPWIGFHKFKQGYGADLVEFTGSYDLVIHPLLYQLYNRIYQLRAVILKLKRRL